MRVAIDTNRLTDFFRFDQDLSIFLGSCDEIYIPLPVLAEIRAGFQFGSLAASNERVLSQFLATPTVHPLLPNLQTVETYARLYTQLRKAGTPIPTNDLWIASLSLQHDLVLITRDKHFKNIPQLILG